MIPAYSRRCRGIGMHGLTLCVHKTRMTPLAENVYFKKGSEVNVNGSMHRQTRTMNSVFNYRKTWCKKRNNTYN